MYYFGDHECDSVVEYYMEEYGRWSYKIVYYVYYNDDGNIYPAFCVEPAKQGVGTGYDSYSAIINKVENMYENGTEKKNQIWRILMKGYMGSTWDKWDLECDDDFYSATKIALHSLAEGVNPVDKYVLGDRSVDGNTVEEIQRRGQNVLDVAQELYEYGLYGLETYEKPSITIIEKGEKTTESIENVEYYIQNYVINSNKELKSYEISIQNFPEGTKILDLNNNEIANADIKNIKIAIPISEIKNDINGTIFVQNANIKTNPIFYCESTEDEAQSYVTYNNKYEIAEANTNLEVKANTSELLIKKVDEETNEPLSNVKFEILDVNRSKITEVTTDENGEARLENLYPQKVYVKEIEAPNGYIINSEEREVDLEYGKISEVSFSNMKQKGRIKITKEDSENEKIKIKNVEFEIIDSNNEVVQKVKTDEYGIAITSDLPVGTYKVHEISTDENYILNSNDEIVKIEYNKDTEITIKNDVKKGQIRIIKVDKDNNKTLLSGVEFEIIDENNNTLEKITTDENGEALTKEYSIKEYKKLKIKEVKTMQEYILTDEIKVIELEESKIKNIIFENEKKKEPEPEVEVELPKLPRTGF